MATLCDSGAVKLKAGVNRNTTLTTEYDTAIQQAESAVNVASASGSGGDVNWIDLYSGLNADVKYILEDAASSYAAAIIVNHDMDGYTTSSQAVTTINFNLTLFDRAIKLLKENYVRKYINGA